MVNPISKEDIKQYLNSRNDFDLELFAYRTLREHGIPAHHGGTYTDPVKGIARQYDVRATKAWDSGTAISLAIECKSLTPECPLIVSCVPRPPEDSYHELIVAEARAPTNPLGAPHVVSRKGLFGVGLYGVEGMVGKKTTQIRWADAKKKSFTGGDQETYEKWSQALASINGLLIDATRAKATGLSFVFTWALPVLVVSDETLWLVKYDEAGTRSDPEEADKATLFVGNSYEPYPLTPLRISHLHIYTRKGFTRFVEELVEPTASRLWHLVFDGVPGLMYP